MIRSKNVVKAPLQSEQEFFIFLKRIREESEVSERELAEGLMDTSLLSRIEGGERPVSKMMRNRLLGRLGVTPDMYENLLNIEDYRIWEQQHDILCAVEMKDIAKAAHLIEKYQQQKPSDDKIRQQFCLMMRAEILKMQRADRYKISHCYETAVQLTIPETEQFYIEDKLLSVLEINMMLEYAYYKKTGRNDCSDFAAKCRFLMDYTEHSLFDEISKAKIYPKIAVYYLEEILSKEHEMLMADLYDGLQICNKAIEMLRDTGRAFYLVELLEYKKKILSDIIKMSTESKNVQKVKEYRADLQESMELEKLLKKLYAEYDVPVYMNDCTYLYHQRWVFAIGDVLCIRRNMCGLTQKEVCDGICSIKSLRRAEKKQVNMQREALNGVLRRLGLSKEIQKTALVTNDREVLQLNNELALCCNNREIKKARKLLESVKSRLCLEIPENMQHVMEFEISLDLMEGKLTEKEFVVREEKALQCTIREENIYDAEEVYLTETEMSCVCRKMQKLGDVEKREKIDFLLHFFEKYDKSHVLAEYISMYEFVMTCVASELGNIGEYQTATELDKKVLKEVLKCRRLYAISEFVYDILWNEKEQKELNGQNFVIEKMTDSLRQCIIISHFCRRTFYEKFYTDKIFQLTQNIKEGLSLQGAINSSSE